MELMPSDPIKDSTMLAFLKPGCINNCITAISSCPSSFILTFRSYIHSNPLLKRIKPAIDTLRSITHNTKPVGYPVNIETQRMTTKGFKIFLRPVKITDEQIIKDFFDSCSDYSLYRRFLSQRRKFPHSFLQRFIEIDYNKQMVILAVKKHWLKDIVIGMGQYSINKGTNTADIAFLVGEEYQNKGICTELFYYLMDIAKKNGIHGFTAIVLAENKPMLNVFNKIVPDNKIECHQGVYDMKMNFRKKKDI